MADAAVEFLLSNVKDILVSHSSLLPMNRTRSQIESLERDLCFFESFLKGLKRRKDERKQALVRNLRDVIWEAEDIIDAIVTQVAVNRTRNCFSRVFMSLVNLKSIQEKVEEITKQIEHSRNDFASLTLSDDEDHESRKFEAPILRRENVVGFDLETSNVIGYLTQQTEKLDVITLVGMPGIGKTTLAGKIFTDPKIKHEFPIRIWVHVSDEFTKERVFLSILRQLMIMITDDVKQKREEELHELVVSHLKSKKFLIVLDDVWSASDRDSLGIAQLASNNKSSKVLITTCNEEVGRWRSANVRARVPHKVRFLSDSESWELLQLEVFGDKKTCPLELETVGRLIADQCGGLPLAIVAMASILLRDGSFSSKNIHAVKTAWIKACQRVPKYRDNKFYDNLPIELQACFLYLAVFPYDFDIPADKLIWMWIAEGFIKEDGDDGLSLEETAETYLQTLIDRNLLEVCGIKDNGRVKTCHIHRLVHDFCKYEAGEKKENIVTEIMLNRTDGMFVPPVSELWRCRRISIHSKVSNFLSTQPNFPRSRAFINFSEEETHLSAENSSAIPRAFRLVRVLDVKPTFTEISSDMFHLLHLRYLALSLNFGTIPKALSKLWNMQTLLVHTTSRTLEVKADILGFTHLRHFKTNSSANLLKPGKNVKGGENLQSLGTISPESCTEELFDRARNLKKLGIRGKLSLLLEGKIASFASLGELRFLESLKLLNDVFPRSSSEGRLRGLPALYQFPPSLRSLTLSGTFLDWRQMSILGLLEHLEVLKLKDNAFVGNTWETCDGGFRRLEALHIAKADLVIWVASARHFPQLRSLRLRHCEELQEVPITLAEIPSFRLLDLFETNLAAASAKKFRDKKLKEQSIDAEEFKLVIN